jgi:hypothetical protein
LRIVYFSTVPEGIQIAQRRSLATGAGAVNRRPTLTVSAPELRSNRYGSDMAEAPDAWTKL